MYGPNSDDVQFFVNLRRQMGNTWERGNSGSIACRLDYFLISTNLQSQVKKIKKKLRKLILDISQTML